MVDCAILAECLEPDESLPHQTRHRLPVRDIHLDELDVEAIFLQSLLELFAFDLVEVGDDSCAAWVLCEVVTNVSPNPEAPPVTSSVFPSICRI
jgi:hypothetical protein